MTDIPARAFFKRINKAYKPKLEKFTEERSDRVKKTLFDFIQDNNVEIVNDDQIYYEGKHQHILVFAEKLKWILENSNKKVPKLSAEDYVKELREINSENHRAQILASTNRNSKFLSEPDILSLVKTEKLDYSKSMAQAEEFLKHILFKIPEFKGFVKVIVRKKYTIENEEGNKYQVEQEMLLPGYKHLAEYQDTLENIPVKVPAHEKQETYWDVFYRSKSVIFATPVYHPYKPLYWCDEFKHYYINTYKEPLWKQQPTLTYLTRKHKKQMMSFDGLSPLLRSFLVHLFPNKDVRNEVLKWCAFSFTDKLQTYLTLIGSPGIGKNVFIEDFLGYYHGMQNVNFPKHIETRFNEGFSKATILFFDEKIMSTLEQYNEMKSYVNRTLAYEEKGKPIYMADNFANIVWSCNTKDTMSGMGRDDRRFKIVPITNHKLIGAPVFDENNFKVSIFDSETIKKFVTDESYKQEFVLLMLSIREFTEQNQLGKDDINTISDNEARDTVFSASRSIEFIEIIDVLKNVFNDYDEGTNKFNRAKTRDEREFWGTIYKDYIPLGKIAPTKDSYYSYRVPYSLLRSVMFVRAGSKSKPMAMRVFNKHIDNMPPKLMRRIDVGAGNSDVEIRLDGEEHQSHLYFRENLLPIVIARFREKKQAMEAAAEQPKEEIPKFQMQKLEKIPTPSKKDIERISVMSEEQKYEYIEQMTAELNRLIESKDPDLIEPTDEEE